MPPTGPHGHQDYSPRATSHSVAQILKQPYRVQARTRTALKRTGAVDDRRSGYVATPSRLQTTSIREGRPGTSNRTTQVVSQPVAHPDRKQMRRTARAEAPQQSQGEPTPERTVARHFTTECLPPRISRAHPFTSERFHVLLNSLFKVLCNFPSRYLFAIGLVAVFSLRWSLPPDLGLHSQATRLQGRSHPHDEISSYGPRTRYGKMPRSEGLGCRVARLSTLTPKRHMSRTLRTPGFGAGLFPFRSPLLRESLLVSFPPLIYMLKFSG